MVYNTGNGSSLQKLPDKSQISGKRQWILLLEIKYFSETTRVDQPEPSVQSEQAGLEQQRKCLEETTKNQLASETYLEILVPYLNNSSEETIFGSNKIKEQHETIKLQNEVHLKL